MTGELIDLQKELMELKGEVVRKEERLSSFLPDQRASIVARIHATRFEKNRRKSQPPLSSRDHFFNELVKKGNKQAKIKLLEKQKQMKDMKECTFKP